MKSRKGFRHWLAFETSSRVVVFRPTKGARTFARRWADKIANAEFNHDEWALSWAYLTSPDLRFSYIPQEYSGREIGSIADAVIAHTARIPNRSEPSAGASPRYCGILSAAGSGPAAPGREAAGRIVCVCAAESELIPVSSCA
jgi:hypothetical protein